MRGECLAFSPRTRASTPNPDEPQVKYSSYRSGQRLSSLLHGAMIDCLGAAGEQKRLVCICSREIKGLPGRRRPTT